MEREGVRLTIKTEVARLLLNCTVITAIFYNPALMELVCGKFTLPVEHKRHLIGYIISLEVLRMVYQPLAYLLARVPGLKIVAKYSGQLLFVKYLIMLALKTFLIFEDHHRKKFYLHTFLLEGTVLSTALLFDFFQKSNIKEAGQLLLIDGLHRLSLVYELTQTFCPNLILYYAITNLLIFVMAQIQAQERYGLNQSLYVKHDIYRFLFMAVIFFGFISIAQLFSSSFKTLVAFALCLRPLIVALQAYSEGRFKQTLNNLLGCCGVLMVCELIFIKVPFRVEAGVVAEL